MQHAIAVRTVPARWHRGRCRRVGASFGGHLAQASARCPATLESPA